MAEDARPGVLFVDDDPRVLSAIVRSLRREPFRLETASDAREAIQRLQGGRFELVVSDQRMPGSTGIELLCQVRARWPSTRRILLSGWTSGISRHELEAADLFRLLAKPWDEGELRSAIREAVGAGCSGARDGRAS